jgi:hypothetical protein
VVLEFDMETRRGNQYIPLVKKPACERLGDKFEICSTKIGK